MSRRRYVYALSDSPLPRLRASGRTIESLKTGPMYAAAARLDALPPISAETLEEQHAVVSRLAQRVDAILPMRFGALVDEDELARLVTLHHAELSGALDLVRGREQMTVRLFGPTPLDGQGQPAAPVRQKGISGTDYLRQRREATRPRPLPPEAAHVRHAVSSLVTAERTEAGEGPVHATLWHLIDRGNAARYREAIRTVAAQIAPVRAVISGPWPPFAFVPRLQP
jgi:hypothetical protein